MSLEEDQVRGDVGGWSSGGCPEDYGVSVESLAAEFPAWECWRGLDNLWHARVKGATPPVMVRDDHLDGLREEIIRKLSKTEYYWKSVGK
jgi:hypothetical protein